MLGGVLAMRDSWLHFGCRICTFLADSGGNWRGQLIETIENREALRNYESVGQRFESSRAYFKNQKIGAFTNEAPIFALWFHFWRAEEATPQSRLVRTHRFPVKADETQQ